MICNGHGGNGAVQQYAQEWSADHPGGQVKVLFVAAGGGDDNPVGAAACRPTPIATKMSLKPPIRDDFA